MKYLVQVSYTNPAHEHVSLRRRVDTVNRIVEAANEEQAILRVSRQQRALGFMVKEANVVKPKAINEDVNESSISYNKPKPKNTDGWSTPKPKPRHTDGWSTPKPKDAGSLPDYVKRGQQEFDRQTKAQNKKPVQAGTLAAVHKSMEREMGMKKEEVEEMHETSMIGGKKLDPKSLVWKQTGMNHSDAVSRHGKENVKIAGKNRFGEPIVHVKVPLGEEVEYIEEKLTLDDPVSKWISDFVHSDNPRFEGKSRKKRIDMALGAYYAAKNEGVEKTYNEKEVNSAEKKQEKKKGSMNKINVEPEMDPGKPNA